jgi:deoxyhypusine synthase
VLPVGHVAIYHILTLGTGLTTVRTFNTQRSGSRQQLQELVRTKSNRTGITTGADFQHAAIRGSRQQTAQGNRCVRGRIE